MALILSIVTAMPALAAPPLHWVMGGGTVDFEGFKETYGFTAKQVDEFGNAKGNMQFVWHYPSFGEGVSPWIMYADVLYLAVDADTGAADKSKLASSIRLKPTPNILENLCFIDF